MKVCIINPPWEENNKWGIRSGCRFPNLMPIQHNSYVPFPFLLAYTASYLESKGIEVLLIDAVAERYKKLEFIDKIKEYLPDVIIAETSTASFNYDLGLLKDIRSQLKTIIVLFGPHVSVLPQEALASSAVDFVIRGEPEYTGYELIRAIESKSDLKCISGIAYKDTSGQIRINAARQLISDIDSLPHPKREGSSIERYSLPGFPSPVVFIYGSRGCPFGCNFCLWPQTIFETGNYRPRTADNIADEMALVLKQFPRIGSFFFDDDTFNLGRDRLLKFAQALRDRNINIPWGVNARADNLDRELLVKLAEVGLFTLRIGIESGDADVLRNSGKGLNLDEAIKNLRIAHSLKIAIHLSFIIGLAGESWNSVKNSIKFIKSVPAQSVQFSVAVPFPGTKYYDYVTRRGFLVNRDWHDYNGSDTAVMDTEFMTAKEVMQALNYARKKIYFSLRFIARRLYYIRTMKDLSALVRKALSILRYRANR